MLHRRAFCQSTAVVTSLYAQVRACPSFQAARSFPCSFHLSKAFPAARRCRPPLKDCLNQSFSKAAPLCPPFSALRGRSFLLSVGGQSVLSFPSCPVPAHSFFSPSLLPRSLAHTPSPLRPPHSPPTPPSGPNQAPNSPRRISCFSFPSLPLSTAESLALALFAPTSHPFLPFQPFPGRLLHLPLSSFHLPPTHPSRSCFYFLIPLLFFHHPHISPSPFPSSHYNYSRPLFHNYRLRPHSESSWLIFHVCNQRRQRL